MLRISKILAIATAYLLLLAASAFLTMSVLIRGQEIQAPELVGLKLGEAYTLAVQKGIFLKKEIGDFGPSYEPMTVVDQFPQSGSPIKEKSTIKVFVSAVVSEVMVPETTGLTMREADQLLRRSKLRRGLLAFVSSPDQAVDVVIGQSVPASDLLPEGSSLDLLLSRGPAPISFIMPNLIGKRAEIVLPFLAKHGLKVVQLEEIEYFGLRPGIVIKQTPGAGFEISQKSLINLQVSK